MGNFALNMDFAILFVNIDMLILWQVRICPNYMGLTAEEKQHY
jgi:hypothetical protein